MKKIAIFLLSFCLFLNASYLRDGIIQYKNQDYKNAFNSFKNAIEEESSITAYYFLGLLYLKGLGTKQDLDKAEKFLAFASKHGNLRANCLLAEVYIQKNRLSKAKKILKDGQKEGIKECQDIIKKYKINL